jgi:hypothetical protein
MHLRPNAACPPTATTRTILAVNLGKLKRVACFNYRAADFAFLEEHHPELRAVRPPRVWHVA